MSGQTAKMLELTRMVLDTELAKLRQHADAVAAIQGKIDALRAAQRDRAVEVAQTEAEDLAYRTGQDGRWQSWVQAERVRLNLEIARAAALREEQRARTALAWGRVEALEAIKAREAEARRLQLARKAQWN